MYSTNYIFIAICLFVGQVFCLINSIEVQGRQFIDSTTKKPFYIKGVDYQPGGSSAYIARSDPLSNIESCSRDVFLFQQLGINAIRVYTVSPDLNHDECMTLLAQAGIYVILDVNSPRVGESLNRYEPWTSYTKDYIEHILKVVEQFSGYNNTLGFFAGNEIINDEISASSSPNYIKAVIRDIKSYIARHSPRKIPVGYSAADDLRFRTSLAHFLECGDELTSVDFYGVNSYQWCGHQTFSSSGYNTLIDDYKDYSLPIFMSEYGCNAVYPRLFQEVIPLYGPNMTGVFSGGLVYEFTQEPNNYGLVELDQSGNAYTIADFDTLRERFDEVGEIEPVTPKELSRPLVCRETYENLNTEIPIPNSLGADMITNGLPVRRGTFVQIPINTTMHRIYNTNGVEMTDKTIQVIQQLSVNVEEVEDGGQGKKDNTALSVLPATKASTSTTTSNAEYPTASESSLHTIPSNISRRSKEDKVKNIERKISKESSSSVTSNIKEEKDVNRGDRVVLPLVILVIMFTWLVYELV